MLDMLEEKTRGNLTDDEGKLLKHVLGELKLNYVETANEKPAEAAEEKPAEPPAVSEPESTEKPSEDKGAESPEKAD